MVFPKESIGEVLGKEKSLASGVGQVEISNCSRASSRRPLVLIWRILGLKLLLCPRSRRCEAKEECEVFNRKDL